MMHALDDRVLLVPSLLVSMRYSPQATLDLEFRSGAVHRYFMVPRSIVEGLRTAESKARSSTAISRTGFRLTLSSDRRSRLGVNHLKSYLRCKRQIDAVHRSVHVTWEEAFDARQQLLARPPVDMGSV